MRIGSLFSGYGGLDSGVQQVIGGTVAWHCENDRDASKILAHHWPDVPNLGDITAVDWSQVEPVDVLTGGFPCQPVSAAGKQLGDKDERWLWDEVARAVDNLGPRLVVLENVRGLLTARRGRLFGRVLGTLADLGYDAIWHGLRAADIGAPHGRWRVFVIAHPRGEHWQQWGQSAPGQATGGWSFGELAGRDRAPVAELLPTPTCQDGANNGGPSQAERNTIPLNAVTDWGKYAPAIERWEQLTRPAPAPTQPSKRTGKPQLSPAFVEWMMGLPARHVSGVDISRNAQLKALGNGVVPQQAAAGVAWCLAAMEVIRKESA